jgi:uncharacterized protein (DUF697 family)
MNKKKLPKAIMGMADYTHETRSVAEANDRRQTRVGASEPKQSGAGAAVAQEPAHLDETLRADSKIDTEQRKSLARAVVERHAAYSAVGGIIPLPIANIASVTAVIVRMVKVLSDLYGVPFERDRARAIVVGLMGGAMPTGLAAATTSTLVYVIPGSNLIGLAVSSMTAIACTRSIGRIFIEHFESGATLVDFQRAQTA